MNHESLKRNYTKYSGLTLSALEMMIDISIPVAQDKLQEVWKELFHRYFNEERLFNIYKLILRIKTDKKYLYFSKAIELELVHEKTEIPTHHTEDFMRILLEFIEFVDSTVLSKGNVKFEWQLHSLSGLADIMEKIKKAKVRDNILKQKINLFVDKINNSRKESLKELESKKEEEEKKLLEVKEVVNTIENENALVTVENTLAVIKKETALMKQELKHLDIPLSKTRKGELLEMLEHLKLYYPEDKKKIITRALKLYYYEAVQICPLDCFAEMMNLKNEGISMSILLINAFCGVYDGCMVMHRSLKQSDIDLFVPGGTKKDLLDYLSNWLLSIEGMTTNSWMSLMLKLSKELDTELNKKLYTDILKNSLEVFNKYKGKQLSDILNGTVDTTKNELDFKSRNSACEIMYSKAKGNWIVVEKEHLKKTISILEYYELVFEALEDILFEYTGNYLENTNIKYKVSNQDIHLINELISFHLSITIDDSVIDNVMVKECLSRSSRNEEFSESITELLKHKFCQDRITKKEIKFLYKDHYDFFLNFADEFHGLNHAYYFTKYFEEAMNLFDFAKQEELKQFFKFKIIDGGNFFDDGSYGYRKEVFSKTLGNKLIRKLEEECPHEVMLIADYFNVEEQEYVEFDYYDNFKNLTPIEKLLLAQNGVELGRDRVVRGYKNTRDDNAIILSVEELKNKYIIEYFHRTYGQSL